MVEEIPQSKAKLFQVYYRRSSIKTVSIKGQIISEQYCGVLNFPKKQRNYFKDFCPSH